MLRKLAILAGISAIPVALSGMLGCAKLGVSAPTQSTSSAASSPAVAPVVAPTPKVEITTPKRGAFLAAGLAAVEGFVTRVDGSPIATVSIGGQPVQVDANDRFRTMLTLTSGLNVIEANGVDAQGRNGATSIGVLAGDYKAMNQRVSQAAIGRLNTAALDACGKLAEAAFWTMDWTTILKGLNPIFDSNLIGLKAYVDIEQARFRSVSAKLEPRVGNLLITIDITEPMIDVTCAAAFGSSPPFVHFPAIATADLARLTANASVSVRPDGSFATTVTNPQVSFPNFGLQVSSNSIITVAIELLAKNAIEKALRNFIIESLRDDLPPFMDDCLGKYLQQKAPWDIYGKPFEIDVRGENVSFDQDGVSFALGFNALGRNVTALGAAAPGSFVTPGAAPPGIPNRGFWLTADDDAANRCLHAMWAGGVFDFDLDQAFLTAQNVTLPIALEAGQLRRFMPEIGAVVSDTAPIKIHIEPGLPPIVKFTGAPDLVRFEAGEVALDIFVDRGNGWEKLLRAVVHMNLGANCAVSGQGFDLSTVSNPVFKFDLVEEPLVELDDRRLEVVLSVLLTPMVPHLMNSAKVIGIPHLRQLTAFNVDFYADGPQREHIAVAGDMTR